MRIKCFKGVRLIVSRFFYCTLTFALNLIFNICRITSMPVICKPMATAISLWPRGSFHMTLMYSGFITVTASATKIGKPQRIHADMRELVVSVRKSSMMRKRSRIVCATFSSTSARLARLALNEDGRDAQFQFEERDARGQIVEREFEREAEVLFLVSFAKLRGDGVGHLARHHVQGFGEAMTG